MIGTVGFVGERLTEALQARGITATALAQMLGVTPMSISQYVSGKTTPRPEVMAAISQKLNLPESFFKRKPRPRPDDHQEVFWRSFSSASKTARTRAAKRLRWLKELVSYLSDYVDMPTVNVPRFELPQNPLDLSFDRIEELAGKVRTYWNIDSGPISDLSLLLENNGVLLSRWYMETDRIDAFSQWSDADSRAYIVLSADKFSAVRSRYDAAHELGHLVLHRLLDNAAVRTPAIHKVIEEQAFRFGAALLLPEREFVDELWAPTLDAFRSLKDRWRVSIGVMIKRSAHIGLINEDQEKRLWMNYNRRGWRLREPLDDSLAVEQPRLLRRSIQLLVSEGVRAKSDITSDLPFSVTDIEELGGLPVGYFSEGVDESPIVIKPRTDPFGAGNPQPRGARGSVIPFDRKL